MNSISKFIKKKKKVVKKYSLSFLIEDYSFFIWMLLLFRQYALSVNKKDEEIKPVLLLSLIQYKICLLQLKLTRLLISP